MGRKKILSWRVLVMCVLLVLVGISLFPIYWMFITSFKTNADVAVFPPDLTVKNPTVSSYVQVLNRAPVLTYLRNSTAVCGIAVGICLVLGSLTGYGFSRFRFRGSNLLLLLVIGTRMVPPISLTVPFYLMAKALGILNTWSVLIMCYVFLNLPFAIWIMTKFFDSVPTELYDAALVDGCSRIGWFSRIGLPLALPGLGAVAIISLLWSWSEFLYAFIYTLTPAAQTITVGVFDFIADAFIAYNWLAAGGVFAVLPVIIFVMIFQRFIVGGLVTGSVKG